MKPFRDPRGSNHRKSKLTTDQVRELRRLAEAGVSTEELSKQFKIDRTQVRKIVKFHAYWDVE